MSNLEDDLDPAGMLARKEQMFGVNGDDIIEEELFSDAEGGDASGDEINNTIEKKKKKEKKGISPSKTSKKEAKKK